MEGMIIWPDWPLDRTWSSPVDSRICRSKVAKMIDVTLDWYEPNEEDWNEARCVYAYLEPETKKIIYIGKADDSSPRERWNGHERDGLFEFFKLELDLEECDVIFGEVEAMEGMSNLSFE